MATNPTPAEADLIFALNAVDTDAEQLDLIRAHVERENAKLRDDYERLRGAAGLLLAKVEGRVTDEAGRCESELGAIVNAP